ncbi:MAG: NAD(P)-dependent oxidoreductase [Gammaproteobacteria bacterium]|nr:MAG: NAD(P)-dependent oxidoreductase [Gammaproteobacteria bacterium]
MKIAWLGTGLMGRPMATRLVNAGHEMVLWNRTEQKARDLAHELKVQVAHSVPDAVGEADLVFTMLENGAAVESVLIEQGALDALKPGTTVVDMSSIEPERARRLHARAEAGGGHFVDAPVSGGTVGAEAGTLSIMAGGQRAVVEALAPVLSVLGKVTYIGPPGAGQLCKLANQAIVGITIGAVSEALLLAARGGADPSAVREALMGGFAASRILELHGERMIRRNFEPGAPARIQLKDMHMIVDEGRNEGLTLPLSQRVLEMYRELVADGHSEVDHSGLLLALEHLNGVVLGDPKPMNEQ